MKFALHVIPPPKAARMALYESVTAGATKCGDEVYIVNNYNGVPEGDGTIIYGIAGQAARIIFDQYLAAGKHVLFFDKGYTRVDALKRSMVRVAIDSFQPLAYLDKIARPLDRLRLTGVVAEPYYKLPKGDSILFDGATNKYCQWYGLGNQVDWGTSIIERIRQHTDRIVIYRPRPDHNPTPVIYDVHTSLCPLQEDLSRAHVVVSHGGNLGWDAVVAGRPHFAIDISIARPMSETRWSHLDTPYVPVNGARQQWMANVCYCQWTFDELADGAGWRIIKQQLEMSKANRGM